MRKVTEQYEYLRVDRSRLRQLHAGLEFYAALGGGKIDDARPVAETVAGPEYAKMTLRDFATVAQTKYRLSFTEESSIYEVAAQIRAAALAEIQQAE